MPGEPGLALGVAKPVAPPESGDLVDMARQILDDELRSWQSRTGPSRIGPTHIGPSQSF
jgi:hypothetical protein